MAGERDLNKSVSTANCVLPGVKTALGTGTGVDLANYRSAMFVAHIGTITDGSWVFTAQESDDDSTYTDVSSVDLSGSFTTRTAGNDEAVEEVGYLGTKRYIRVLHTPTLATTGGAIGVTVVRGNPITKPAT